MERTLTPRAISLHKKRKHKIKSRIIAQKTPLNLNCDSRELNIFIHLGIGPSLPFAFKTLEKYSSKFNPFAQAVAATE